MVKSQSNVNGPVPPLAEALNVHDSGAADGATHGVLDTVKSAAALGLPVVPPVVVVEPGPLGLSPPHAACAAINNTNAMSLRMVPTMLR